jgi:hypothetical protein
MTDTQSSQSDKEKRANRQTEMVKAVILEAESYDGYGIALAMDDPPKRLLKIYEIEKKISAMMGDVNDGIEFDSLVKSWKAELKIIDLEMKRRLKV